MSRPPNFTTMQLIAYFAANPECELTTSEICNRTGVEQRAAYMRFDGAVRNGILSRKTPKRGRVSLPCIYAAGPELLRIISLGMPDHRP
jgi:hypothetical protein